MLSFAMHSCRTLLLCKWCESGSSRDRIVTYDVGRRASQPAPRRGDAALFMKGRSGQQQSKIRKPSYQTHFLFFYLYETSLSFTPTKTT